MPADQTQELEGGCACGQIRYRLTSAPIYVHCCHCRWCQREAGSAFVLNALIEADRVELLKRDPVLINTPSESSAGQKIYRCPECQVAVWSNYAMAVGDKIRFIRVGTLDEPDRMPPDIHIFTASKQPWLTLPGDARVVAEYYNRKEVWPAESLDRFNALRS